MTLSLFSCVSLLVTILILRHLSSLWYHSNKARKWDCASIPHYPADALGIKTLKEALRADKEGLLPPLMEFRLEKMIARENRNLRTFKLNQIGREIIFTCDPINVQAILATKFKDFELGPIRHHTLAPLLGTGIFTSDGETWSRSRAKLRPQFTREQISDLDLEERHVQHAMGAMPVDSTTGWTANTDIQAIFFRLTIDSATEFLFGESAESQVAALRGGDISPQDNFPVHFDRSQWYMAQRVRFERLYWIINNRESRHANQRVHAYVDRFVDAALKADAANDKHRPSSSSGSYVFLDALVASTKDPIELRSQLLNVLLAGRDTTASMLSYAILMLARHPTVLKKLRDAILTNFGPYTSSRDSITFTSLKSCCYLQHFMNEVLRLYPPVPINRRMATCDTFLPRGGGPDGEQPVYVRAGQPVMYSVYVTQRRKDFWGEDSNEFNPDRWIDRRSGWEYHPFNGGPRVCIGQQFALTEAGYVLVRFLQRFDAIEDVYPERDIRFSLTLTSAPRDPVTVRLHEAAP